MTDVYTYVRASLKTYNENINVSGIYPRTDAVFPCVYICETGRSQEVQFSTLTNDDDQYRSTFEIQVFCKGDTAKSDCSGINNVAVRAMKELGYRLDSYTVIPGEDKYYNVATRWHRVIGGGDFNYEMSVLSQGNDNESLSELQGTSGSEGSTEEI